MIELIDQQRKIKIILEPLRAFIKKAVEIIPETLNKSLTIAFVSDRRMRELNKMFRGKSATTDVLSFPFEAEKFETDTQNLGDIVISVEQAARQAEENNLEFEIEIKQLILHGILHLSGYDHEIDDGEMNTLELELRDKLGITDN